MVIKMDKYQKVASKIIDMVSDYIEEHYGITYMDKKTEKEADRNSPEKTRALIYGEDYYNMENEIADKIKSFDVFFSDLVPKTQKEALKFLKIAKPEDGNFDIFPLATITSQDVEEFNQESRRMDKDILTKEQKGVLKNNMNISK